MPGNLGIIDFRARGGRGRQGAGAVFGTESCGLLWLAAQRGQEAIITSSSSYNKVSLLTSSKRGKKGDLPVSHLEVGKSLGPDRRFPTFIVTSWSVRPMMRSDFDDERANQVMAEVVALVGAQLSKAIKS